VLLVPLLVDEPAPVVPVELPEDVRLRCVRERDVVELVELPVLFWSDGVAVLFWSAGVAVLF
jgi:hypothetical protein